MKIGKPAWIQVIVFTLVAILSATAVAAKAGSVDSKVSKSCIEQLDKQRDDAEVLAASAVGLSVAVSMLPGNIGDGVSNKLADISGYILIVLCAIFVEKYMLTLFGLLAFRILIPIGCALVICGVFFQGAWKKLGARLIVYGLVIYLLVPASLFVSGKIHEIYNESYEDTIRMAQDSTDEAKASTEEADESAASDAAEGDGEGGFSWKHLQDSLNNTKTTIGKALNSVTDHAKAALKSAQDTLNRMLEYVAVMIVTSCLIPLIVLVIFVSLSNAVLGTNFQVKPAPVGKYLPRKKHGDREVAEAPEEKEE